MQTGMIDSWTGDPNLIGPLYPFVGSEMLLVIIAVVVWLVWMVWQIRHENATYREEVKHLKKGSNLQKALGEYQVTPRTYFSE